MKKQIFGGIAIVAIAVAVALNVNMVNKKSDKTSLLALANVEALADPETSEEYTNATGCIACWDNHTCTGKNGVTYSYSHRP